MKEESKVDGLEIYEAIAMEEPNPNLSGNGGVGLKTLEAGEADTTEQSDLALAFQRLFPTLGSDIHQALMVARIAPDMLIPLLRNLVNAKIRRMNPHELLNVSEVATLFYILTSIGLDGKGRIDGIELTGSVKESAEELAELAKGGI